MPAPARKWANEVATRRPAPYKAGTFFHLFPFAMYRYLVMALLFVGAGLSRPAVAQTGADLPARPVPFTSSPTRVIC